MIVYVIDGMEITDLVEVFESLIWNVQFWDVSDFELAVPATERNMDALQVGRRLVLERDIDTGTYRNVMQIESRALRHDAEAGWVLTLTGSGLKKMVGQRIVWSQTNLTGTVEAGIRQVITENIISPVNAARAIPNFILANAAGIADTFETQLFGDNIAAWLTTICPQYGIGWDVYISGGKYVFELKKGTDRSYNQTAVPAVVFSPEYDNLLSNTYTYSRADYKNAALVGGEGEGTSKRTAEVGTAAGLDRFEAYIDGGSVSSNGDIITLAQYIELLKTYGQEQLVGTAFNEKFEGEIAPYGLYSLGEDYFLGDIVQIVNDHGIRATSRILEIIYSEDRNGSAYTPTFSEWEV